MLSCVATASTSPSNSHAPLRPGLANRKRQSVSARAAAPGRAPCAAATKRPNGSYDLLGRASCRKPRTVGEETVRQISKMVVRLNIETRAFHADADAPWLDLLAAPSMRLD